MALIKCPECGKEISDKAEACIHCGYPLKQKREESQPQSGSQLRCPKCGSTNITAPRGGWNVASGIMGAVQTNVRCSDCGYKWRPQRN